MKNIKNKAYSRTDSFLLKRNVLKDYHPYFDLVATACDKEALSYVTTTAVSRGVARK